MDSTKPLNDQNRVAIESMVLTDDEIKAGQLDPSDLYEVNVDGKVVGPIFKVALKENLKAFNLEDNTQIKSLSSSQWMPLYEHPFFQRRGLKVVAPSTELNPSDEYYILISGQKDGPITMQEIEDRISKKELLVTDTISSDNGSTWIKIYELDKFNRRKVESNELPTLPSDNDFEHSKLEVVDSLNAGQEWQDTEDAIVGLAFINNVNVNKAEDKSLEEATSQLEAKATTRNIKLTITVGAMIVVAITWALLSRSPEPTRTPSSEIVRPKSLRVEPIKRARTLPKKKASIKSVRKPKVTEKRLSKSFDKKMRKAVPFGESDAYKFRSDYNEGTDPSAFLEGEEISPTQEISPEEMERLQERLNNSKFSIRDISDEDDGPESEGGLFDEEASF